MEGHPVMLMLCGSVAESKNISEAQAFNELHEKIRAIAGENGWVQGDEVIFPLNRAFIITT